MMSRPTLFAILVALTACAEQRLPPARFVNASPVTVVDDRRDVPVPPKREEYLRALHNYDGHFHKRLSRALGVPRARRALGVNALDEVPDSTWFTNRIGVRSVTPDAVRVGPVQIASPETHKPWSIRSSKVGGNSVGFVITDARGERFLLKFDVPGFAEVETAAHVITNRLLWAAGFNVPEDHVVYLRSEDLVLAPDAVTVDVVDGPRKLTVRDVQDALARIERGRDGSLRGLASRVVAGKVLGGHPELGVRRDDPNDRIPHELRRDLRGAMALYAWLDHGDLNRENFLDVWTADPADPSHHYVAHYLIDFGKSLGAMASIQRDKRRGFVYLVPYTDMLARLVSLGLVPRPWDDRPVPELRGVGLYAAIAYDPAAWTPDTATYVPWLTSDRLDKFWGAKLIARFTRPQLRAAVEAARLTDPAAVEYFTETLWARGRKTARHWFMQVNPLDRFEISRGMAGPMLCFDDLMLVHRLGATAGTTRYTITPHDRAGGRLAASSQIPARPLGRTCTGPLALTSDRDAYTIVRVTTARPGFEGSTYVHVAHDPVANAPRVVGIWRE